MMFFESVLDLFPADKMTDIFKYDFIKVAGDVMIYTWLSYK